MCDTTVDGRTSVVKYDNIIKEEPIRIQRMNTGPINSLFFTYLSHKGLK